MKNTFLQPNQSKPRLILQSIFFLFFFPVSYVFVVFFLWGWECWIFLDITFVSGN